MAKETNGTWKKVGVITGIVVTLFTAFVAYGRLSERVDTTRGTVNKHDDVLIKLQTDVAEIKTKTDLIYDEVLKE